MWCHWLRLIILRVTLISSVSQLHLFYYCYFGVDSNALSLVRCTCRHGCDAMAIEYENESKNEDQDL